MTIKLQIFPHPLQIKRAVGGIQSLLLQYAQLLPKYGYKIVKPDSRDYDLLAVHAGSWRENLPSTPVAAHCHGLYWTAHLPSEGWEHRANYDVINSIRHANRVCVPSQWVAETFERDFLFTPEVLPHGIDIDKFAPTIGKGDYILAFAKNRVGDICNVEFLPRLAKAFPNILFLSTFAPKGKYPDNIRVIGLQPRENMPGLIAGARVVISPVKETFGILTLEAMASGKPILGYGRGGNVELVNTENGYLYLTPEEMELGLRLLWENPQPFGEQARLTAESYAWDQIMPMVDNFYRKTIEPEPMSVTTVIPYHNQTPHIFGETLQSVLSQTYPTEIIIVNTSSSETFEHTLGQLPFGITCQVVSGEGYDVARARNLGASYATTKYLCFLDGDDMLAPTFLERCVNYLETHPSVHLAYTRITDIFPDGRKQASTWLKDGWDFDASFNRKPQVPTCNVLRRETFNRLGGYDPKFCPTGAGAEDGALWFKFGLYGYKCEKATDEPLFHYRLSQGHTSKKGYVPPDWLDQPRVDPRLLPASTYAKVPQKSLGLNFGPLVRYYDEPEISIGVFAGEKIDYEALRRTYSSLEFQTFPFWEIFLLGKDDRTPIPAYFKRVGDLETFRQQARGEYYLMLGVGDTFPKSFFAQALQYFKQNNIITIRNGRIFFTRASFRKFLAHPEEFTSHPQPCYNELIPSSQELPIPMCGCTKQTLPLPSIGDVLASYGLANQVLKPVQKNTTLPNSNKNLKLKITTPVNDQMLVLMQTALPLVNFKGQSGTYYGTRTVGEKLLVHVEDIDEHFTPFALEAEA